MNLERYVEAMLLGRRKECRETVHQTMATLPDACKIYDELLWPALERIGRLYRGDRIDSATEHMATRIHRSIADQVQPLLTARPSNGKRVVISCADGEPEELAAQIASDIFEADGWEVFFVGGGVPNDEILALVGQLRPDALLIVGTVPQGVPGIRALIDLIRGVDACPTMNIILSGGVFNRTAGLWKEVHADLFAPTITEALAIANAAPPRDPATRVQSSPKKRQRRKRQPKEAEAVLEPATAG